MVWVADPNTSLWPTPAYPSVTMTEADLWRSRTWRAVYENVTTTDDDATATRFSLATGAKFTLFDAETP